MSEENTVSVAPQGFWLKTHFFREGNLFHVTGYSCIAGSPEVFHASIDIRPILKAVMRAHNALHAEAKISGEEISGFFDTIVSVVKTAAVPTTLIDTLGKHVPGYATVKETVRSAMPPQMRAAAELMDRAADLKLSSAKKATSLGKAALVSQLSTAVKSAVQAHAGGKIQATSAAFPGVSLSSLAAYSTATKNLDAIKTAASAMATAKKIASTSDPKLKAALTAGLTKWAGSTIKDAVASKVAVPSGMGPIAQAVKLATDRAKLAKANLANIALAAKGGSVKAQQLSRVITLAHSAQTQLQGIKHASSKNMPKVKGKAPASSNLNGFPAVLVHSSGRIIPGRFLEKKGAPSAVILRKGKVLRGNFAAVSGDLFDVSGLFGRGHAHHGGQDDVGSIGCSNPFMSKPGHLR